MSGNQLIQVDVKNDRSLSKLGIVTVFLTPELKKELDGEKTKNGETLSDLFARGMALRGFKHLIEKIREKNPTLRIVFTHEATSKADGSIYVDYDGYKKATSEKFFSFYRETGLDAASCYLNHCFPTEYEYDSSKVSEADVKKFERNFEQVISKVPKKRKNKKALIDQTSKVISELSAKKKLLKQEVEDLEKLRNTSNIFFFQSRLEELKERLTKTYPETKGKNSWQEWVYKNNWLLGINYQTPIEKQKINVAGSMPDFLFPTMDGFLDILEIKLPSKAIIVKDTDHNGSYAWSSDANKAIGQVVTYLNDIELYQLHLRDEIKRVYGLDLYLIKPRAFILIGNKDEWTEEQHKALRKLNYSLHGIEVLSYTDLVQRGNEIIANYTSKYSSPS